MGDQRDWVVLMGAVQQILAAGGAATPIYRAKGTDASQSSAGSNLSVGLPASPVAGNYHLMFVSFVQGGGSAPSLSTPSGWTSLADSGQQTVDASNRLRGQLFGRFWQAGDAAVSLGTSSASYARAAMFSFTGCNPTTPTEAAAGAIQGSTATPSYQSVTTLGSNRLLCHFMGSDKGDGSVQTGTPGSGWTEQYESNSGDGTTGGDWRFDTQSVTTASTISGATATMTVGFIVWSKCAVALYG